jgi:hypothetical protein
MAAFEYRQAEKDMGFAMTEAQGAEIIRGKDFVAFRAYWQEHLRK